MVRTVVATFTRGKLAPAESLPLKEGQKVRLTVTTEPELRHASEIIRKTSGAWADQLDCEQFERDVYARRHRLRKPARL